MTPIARARNLSSARMDRTSNRDDAETIARAADYTDYAEGIIDNDGGRSRDGRLQPTRLEGCNQRRARNPSSDRRNATSNPLPSRALRAAWFSMPLIRSNTFGRQYFSPGRGPRRAIAEGRYRFVHPRAIVSFHVP